MENKTINGYGILRFFWYIYFEILCMLSGKDVNITNCVIKNFQIKYQWELKFKLAKKIAYIIHKKNLLNQRYGYNPQLICPHKNGKK